MNKSSKRMKIWIHNGFLGSIAMAMRAMDCIIKSTTTSHQAKKLAYEIWDKLNDLKIEIKTNRID